jgi:hypothetical protein
MPVVVYWTKHMTSCAWKEVPLNIILRSQVIRLGLSAAATTVLLAPLDAEAYIGPGAGLSAIASLLALIVAIFAALVGFVWFPVKRLLRRKTTAPAVVLDEEGEQSKPGASGEQRE